MIDPAACLKMIADLSLYLAIAGLFLPSAGAAVPAGIIALSGMLGAALSGKKNVLRLLPLVPLLTALFFIHSVKDAVLILPGAAYVFAAVWTGRLYTDHYMFTALFKKMAIGVPGVLLAALFMDKTGAVAANALPYAVCYLFSGVLLTRFLRLDEATRREPRFLLLNLLFPALSILTAVLFASRTFLAAAGGVLGFFYDKIINPLIIGAAYAIYGVIYVFQKGFSLLAGERAETIGSPSAFVPDEAEADFMLPVSEGDPLAGRILLALGLIVFLVLMFLLFKRLLGTRGAAVSAARDVGTRGTAERMDGGLDLSALLRPKSNADAVRQVYRKFLSRARGAGTVISISDTSAVIAKRASAVFDAALVNELREIYILARYSTHPISREQVRRAKSIYAELKKAERV